MSEPLKTILFVDDEAHILSSLKRLMLNEGYEILTATAPSDGLKIIQNKAVNVVISDYRMPKMTGAEFLKTVRISHPEIVRIVLSGYADAQVVTEMIEKGEIFRFLLKPWDKKELKSTIEEGLKHQKRLFDLKS